MASPSACQAPVLGQGKAAQGGGLGNPRDRETLKLMAPSSHPFPKRLSYLRVLCLLHPNTKEGSLLGEAVF